MIIPQRLFEVTRWLRIARPQYRKGCGPACVVSAFNYLHGMAITIDQALELWDFEGPFDDIDFGVVASNDRMCAWYDILCLHYGVEGVSGRLVKLQGLTKTTETIEKGLSALLRAIQNPGVMLIYHCLNHYCLIVGYEYTTSTPSRHCHGLDPDTLEVIYEDKREPLWPDDLWVILADCSRGMEPLRSLPWTSIRDDLLTEPPFFYDTRHPERGRLLKTQSGKFLSAPSESLTTRMVTRSGASSHCILYFSHGNISF
ncbi:hypothetical protein GMRT_14262 [Giardia muris]|uniref:Uncharacterized protein n=1 Tax=Giardia muris TaxID=5742 RepID=A0A4Z1TAE7_GIAMU|nr:hypothetical protein GMRT_14262 [Giardia muris]|eukprot:TNJ30197.1 hypothetical protein GMRT_14262 [Giardia muris]